jgi:hypothetical protein
MRQLASSSLKYVLGAQNVVADGIQHILLLVSPTQCQHGSNNANPQTIMSLTQIPGHIFWCGQIIGFAVHIHFGCQHTFHH